MSRGPIKYADLPDRHGRPAFFSPGDPWRDCHRLNASSRYLLPLIVHPKYPGLLWQPARHYLHSFDWVRQFGPHIVNQHNGTEQYESET